MRGSKIATIGLLCAAWFVAPAPSPAQTPPGYQGGEVEGGGTISGKVTWDGSRPNLEPFEINKNPEVCDVDGTGKRASTRLAISADGGVANTVVYLEGVQQGKPLPAEGAVLDQKDCRYSPHISIVPKRAQLTLKSSDAILHNIHMFDAASYNIPFPDKNTVAKRMRKTGIARVQCDAGHGWMSGYVFIVDHPYYTVTGENGSFTLTDVPPGTYTIKMWHEGWDVVTVNEKDGVVSGYEFSDPVEQTRQVELSAGGSASVDFTLSQ